MSVYQYAEAYQHFADLFLAAKQHQEVFIQSPQGDLFTLQHVRDDDHQPVLPDLGIHLSRQEILQYIRESRER